MLVRYLAIWKLHGASKIAAGGSNVRIAELDDPRIVATITEDPEQYFFHIDRSRALGILMLTGVSMAGDKGVLQTRLAAKVGELKADRTKEASAGVFLVFEGETEIPDPEFLVRHGTDEFSVCATAKDSLEVDAVFRPFMRATLAALGLCLPGEADRGIERIGLITYLVDHDTENPIYEPKHTFGDRISSAPGALTEDFVARVGEIIPAIINDDVLVRPTSLMATSFDQAMGPLQSFIAVWSALEIFVNATFKATYESRWFDIMEEGAPTAAKPIFERLKEVMSDKYRVADKFLIVASVLDADAATPDADEFRKLKRIRDDLLHGLQVPARLPTEAIQRLLLKYMRLHIDTQIHQSKLGGGLNT
ncbi:MAG: hypothetical protein KF899_11375 [Parvibaculum sp.]|nr:hypothetical protein [Parvibaculum sp.]